MALVERRRLGRDRAPIDLIEAADAAGERESRREGGADEAVATADSDTNTGADTAAVSADRLLARAAGGLASHLLGYYPSPVRQHMFRYEIYAPAYVDDDGRLTVQVYAEQVPILEPGERGVFLPAAHPADARPVELAAATGAGPAPSMTWDRSTALVRFAFVRGPDGRAA